MPSIKLACVVLGQVIAIELINFYFQPKSKLHPKTKKSIAEMIQTTSQEMPASSSS